MKSTSEVPFILHICISVDWSVASGRGEYKPASFDEIGFIHCSTPQQLLKVANAFYRNTLDLLVLWIDPTKLNVPLKWEAADGDRFPHIYGALNLPAVVAVYDFLPDSNGIFREIPGLAEHGKS